MQDDDSLKKIYKDIKKNIHKRYEARKSVAIHVVIFATVMVGVWGVADAGQAPTVIEISLQVMSFGWLIGLLAHGTDWLFDELRDRALMHDLESAGILSHKVKRDETQAAMRLSDDGELVEVDFAAGSYEERREQH